MSDEKKVLNTQFNIPAMKPGLGRGLSALLGEAPKTQQENSKDTTIKMVSPSRLAPNPYQPRKEFKKEAMDELIESIREKGILQPLLVRPINNSPEPFTNYQIIAGERRYRASKVLNLKEIPVIVKQFSDKEALEIGLIENLQREDLSPIEEARAYEKLMKEFEYTQETLSKMIGKSRPHIANSLRLLGLPNEVAEMVDNAKISAGHARTIIGTENPIELAQKVLDEQLTVRELEDAVRGLKTKKPASNKKNADLQQLALDFSAKLNTTVKLTQKSEETGEIRIAYSSVPQLKEILERLKS